ncbi:MAG TPA: GNAT family N-acetyltransferase [Cytophagaceae bacterium]
MNTISIATYRPEWKIYFEQFNKAWIEKYYVLEEIDKYVLSNPEEAILKDGGEVLFAVYNEKVIGAVALRKVEDTTMELTKMAVDVNYQGLGAGKLLCQSAINWAKERKVKKLILYSNSILKNAIHIYKKLGFQHTAIDEEGYKRADVKMELYL